MNNFFRIYSSFTTLSMIVCCLLIIPLFSCRNSPDTEISESCVPTPFDEIGPFYRPNAPVRDKVGNGYLLKGRVLSVDKCAPLPRAQIEFWLVNTEGEYDDAHRATVIADSRGRYSFESNRPTNYYNRRPHIHMRITARGHEESITQHYPKEGDVSANFDIVLTPLAQ